MRIDRRTVYFAIVAYSAIIIAISGLAFSQSALVALLLVIAASMPPLYTNIGAPLLYAGLVYASSISHESMLLAMPGLITLPLIFHPREIRIIDSRLIFLGPSVRRVVLYTLGFSLGLFISVEIIYPLLLAISSSILYSVVEYMDLRGVRIARLRTPSFILLGSKGSASIRVKSHKNAWLVVVLESGDRYIYRLKPGINHVSLGLRGESIGVHTLRLEVYVVDYWGLSQREILASQIEYRVAPSLRGVVTRYTALLGETGGGEESSLEVALYGVRGRGSRRRLYRLRAGGLGGAWIGTGISALEEPLAALAALLAGPSYPTPSSRKRRIGEYVSARPYIAGDDPRSIHWKKSLKLLELVVKEYSEESGPARGGRGGGAGQVVFVVDLASSTPSELNRILKVFIERLAHIVCFTPSLETVIVFHKSGKYLVLRGVVAEALEKLSKILEDYYYLVVSHDYSSTALDLPEQVARGLENSARKPLTVWRIQEYAETIVKLLLINTNNSARRGVKLTIIHGVSSAVRNSFLEYMARAKLEAFVEKINVAQCQPKA